MDTYVTLTYPSSTPEELIKGAFSLISDFEKKLEAFRNGSEKADSEINKIIKEALIIAESTDGNYDPTLKPVVDLWGFHGSENKTPLKPDIQAALAITGWKKIIVSSGDFSLPPGGGYDLGGIAKGWIIDKVKDYLYSGGVSEGIVEVGGDLVVWGNRKWRIGVRDPFDHSVFCIIETENSAVATSGDYERNFIDSNGIFRHHIIDPQTGYPVDNSFKSCTVISDSCTHADAMSTALFVGGESYFNKLDKTNYMYLVIRKDRKLIKSSSLNLIYNTR